MVQAVLKNVYMCNVNLGNVSWGKKYPAPVFGGEKNVAKQHGCRDRFDQSEKISWFDFQGLV